MAKGYLSLVIESSAVLDAVQDASLIRLTALRLQYGGKNSRRQRGAQHSREIGAEVGLCQQQHAGVEPAVMDEGVLGIAGGVEHFEGRPPLECLGRELAAVHSSGQHHVGE